MLLERTQALATLSGLRAQATQGGRVALISGEAGIGKTTLLREFARDAIWGACDPLFTPRPLGPLHDMAAGLGGAVAAMLARDAGRVAVFGAVLDALGRDPRCLVFEDLHWADEATLDLLAWLGRRIERTGTLLLASYRDDEIGPTHPLRRVLGALPGAARISLPRLSAEAVCLLAGARAVDAQALHRVSGGNPFFVTELLAVGSAQIVPPTVRDAVLARIAPLPAAARAALEVAAVLGPRIEPPVLEAVAGCDATTLDACMAAGVLQDAGSALEFRHELARQAVIGSMSSPHRQDLHRRVLRVLRAEPGIDPARLAEHAEAAQDCDAVLEFARQAAHQAVAFGARREAKAQYERALRWAEHLPPTEQVDLLEAFAWECLAVGATLAGIEARRRAIALCAQRGEVPRQAENLCRLTNLLINAGHHAEADAALRQAFDLLRPLPPCRELGYAWRTQAHLSMMRSDDGEAIRAGDEAIALAERFGDREALISALNSQGASLTHLDFEAGHATLARSRQLAQDSGRLNQVFGAEINLGETALEAHRFARAEPHLVAAIAIADDLQMDPSPAQGALACCWLHLGRWSEAGDLAHHVLTVGFEPRVAHVMARVALGRLRARRGDAGVSEALDHAITMARGAGVLQYLGPVHVARAEAAWLDGDAARCRDEARAAYGLAQQHAHAWYLGEMAYWRRLSDDAVEVPECAATPYALQMAGRWREAASAWRALACPYEAARALAEGDPEACREALVTFERLGARPAAEAVRRRLQSAGVRGLPRGPRAATREQPFGLTPRELQVLQFLCGGLRNAEIAERLSRSVRTIDHHLAAVFAKLGVDSRVAAIQAAQRAGLAVQSGQSPTPK
jgi:DNA-binding CsgD family transcriptional regulator/tetratricopeptide (TPR) repeat protein